MLRQTCLAIPRHHVALMQRILDLVSRGYRFHTQGFVPVPRAQRLADKFAERYGVAAHAHRRAQNRAHHRASAQLLVYPHDPDRLEWWLLATTGRGLVHEHERLRDASDVHHPITLAGKYRLARDVRPGKEGGGVHWTWHFLPRHLRAWEYAVIHAARRSAPYDLQRAVDALAHVPLWHGTRTEVLRLLRRARKVWLHNSMRPTDADIDWPAVLPWPRRVRVFDDPPITLAMLVMAYERQVEANPWVDPGTSLNVCGQHDPGSKAP